MRAGFRQFILFLTVFVMGAGGAFPSAQARLLTGYGDQGAQEEVLSLQGEQVEVMPLPPVSAQKAPAVLSRSSFLTGYNQGHGSVGESPVSSVSAITPVGEGRSLPAPASVKKHEAPVDLSADQLVHDEKSQIITAAGNVVLKQSGRTLEADRIRYNLATDTVTAEGNVVLQEVTGDVYIAENVKLTNEMRHGFVKGLQSYLAEGGRFTAAEAERIDQNTITLKQATYTPCECEHDNDGNPAWQIKAGEITYHEDENRISYKNARFEMFGVPVAYTPVLSHPDGKIKRKSGILAPGVGFDSELGLKVVTEYYWDVAPDKDATLGVMLTSNEVPVGMVEYRQRFSQAEIQLNGSATYSERTDSIAGEDVKLKDEWRGHLFADGLWNINEKWRTGFDVELTSDDQYLRQYDFSSKDVLENEIYVERFSGRDYSVGRVLAFQDVRVREEPVDQPNILPEVQTVFVGEPNALLGGRWKMEGAALGLQREGKGQDVNRLVLKGGWQKRHVTGFGLVNTLDASVRGDVYHVTDRDAAPAGAGRSTEGTDTRVFPQLHMVSSYPLVKPYEKMQAVIEPVAAFTAAPDINVVDDDIPNEDSQDVQIDASNLFEANRFPGLDRLEDESRVTYGMRSGLYGYGGSFMDVFLGQSYRLDKDDNPFPEGSGLDSQDSDVVGQVSGLYDNRFGMNYRFQLDNKDMTSQRHEFDGYAHWDRLRLGSRYLFAKALAGRILMTAASRFRVWLPMM